MTMTDYQTTLTRMQKALADAYKSSPHVLNVPGQSVACKVDPEYYLALEPIFTEIMSRWAVTFPDNILNTLSHTGNIVINPIMNTHIIPLSVSWDGRDFEVQAAFIPAEFVERALKLYAGISDPLPVSDLRIKADERAAVDAFFEGKTAPSGVAYV
jgi:hypothetical protein